MKLLSTPYTKSPTVRRSGLLIATLAWMLPGGLAFAQGGNPCTTAALQMLISDWTSAQGDLWEGVARAQNLATAEETADAVVEARAEYDEALSTAAAVHSARRDLCGRLGEGKYTPDVDPDHFLDPSEIAADPNPLLPLVPGTTYRYEGETDEGTEVIVVAVTHETREIMDVECIVVRDTVTLDGETIEDTFDWYSQDEDGNVWYFGELSFEIEEDEIVSLEGSWEAGEEGAQPGIVMEAEPEVGDLYRQEYLLGEAEDIGVVWGENRTVTVPWGTYTGCLKTGDFTPLEPGSLEHKFYAPDVGFLMEVKPATGEKIELVEVTTGN